MSIELWSLLGVTLIMFAAIMLQQLVVDLKYGIKYALSNRETPPDTPSPAAGRMTRLVRNHVEGLAVFAPLVLIAAIAGVSNNITQIAALVVLGSRFLHLIFYAFGVTPLRSLVWGPGFMIATPAFIYGIVASVGLPF